VSLSGARILVVDDEPAIVRVVRSNLEHRQFEVQVATTCSDALERHRRWRPDAVILDLGLPDEDGMAFIRAVRETGSTPIVVLSARGAERDKVEALEAGADDYLAKPFGIEELIARVRVALRHAARPPAGEAAVFHAGPLEVDLARRAVRVNGAPVHLTPTEYDLLKAFIGHPDRVLTDRRLLQLVWGPEYGSEDHYLHVYVARLRKKLEPDPVHPRLFVTEPGVGYRLVVDA